VNEITEHLLRYPASACMPLLSQSAARAPGSPPPSLGDSPDSESEVPRVDARDGRSNRPWSPDGTPNSLRPRHAAAGAGLNAPADQPRIERVVVGVEAQVEIRRDPQHPPPIDIRRDQQRHHHLALLDEPVARAAAQRLVRARVRPGVEPAVELQRKVELVREHPPRLEAGARRSPAVARRRPCPADRPCRRNASRRAAAAERGERRARTPNPDRRPRPPTRPTCPRRSASGEPSLALPLESGR
jgi:hypothetical protein